MSIEETDFTYTLKMSNTETGIENILFIVVPAILGVIFVRITSTIENDLHYFYSLLGFVAVLLVLYFIIKQFNFLPIKSIRFSHDGFWLNYHKKSPPQFIDIKDIEGYVCGPVKSTHSVSDHNIINTNSIKINFKNESIKLRNDNILFSKNDPWLKIKIWLATRANEIDSKGNVIKTPKDFAHEIFEKDFGKYNKRIKWLMYIAGAYLILHLMAFFYGYTID